MLLTIVLPIHLMIGVWCARFWSQFINVKMKTEGAYNIKAWTSSSTPNWTDTPQTFFFVVFQIALWPLLLITLPIAKVFIKSADYAAKELASPRDNV